MIWVLADDRAGNVNQLLGVAEALGLTYERKDIRYTKWVKCPNLIQGASFMGIDKASRQKLVAPWPEVVLSAGRRSFPVAWKIKKLSHGKTKIVQLMNAGFWSQKKADLLILPQHDQYTGKSPNVMQVVGTPHRITPEKLKTEKKHWQKVLSPYPSQRLAVIVGGATKDHPFTEAAAAQLVSGIKALKAASLLMTTSRRTPKEITAFLKKELPEPKFFYTFGDQGENPYFGLLSWADKIIVTGDSMSMCSECCAVGVPVFVFAPKEMIGEKHRRFHQTLYQAGYATPFGKKEVVAVHPLNPAPEIAEKIKKEFLKCK